MSSFSSFTLAQSDVTRIAEQIFATVKKPAEAHPEAVWFGTGLNANDKALLPGSIVKMSDSSYRVVPFKAGASFGATCKLFGVANGDGRGSKAAIDLNNIDSIAMGVLSDDKDAAYEAPQKGIKAFGQPAKLYANVEPALADLTLVFGASRHVGKVDDVLRTCGIVWRPWCREIAAVFEPVAGLPPMAAATAAVLLQNRVVGAEPSFSVARAAHLGSLGVLVDQGSGVGMGTTAADLADFLACVGGRPALADPLTVVLASTVAASSSAPSGESERAAWTAARSLGGELLAP